MIGASILPRILVAGGIAVLAFGAWQWAEHRGREQGRNEVQVKWDADKLRLEREHSKALTEEINRGNAMREDVEDAHQRSQEYRKTIEQHAQTAAAAGDRAGRAERRLRDAAATTALAASAAATAAATAGDCQAAGQAPGMLADVLGRIDAVAGRVAERARIVSGFADAAAAAGAECAAYADAVAR